MWNIRLQRYAPELLQVIQIDRLEPSVHGEQDDVSSPDDLIPLPDTWSNIGSPFEQVVSKYNFDNPRRAF